GARAPGGRTLAGTPGAGWPAQGAGGALFCKMSRTCCGGVGGLACRSRATAPAVCGDDIDVPLSVAYPPSSSGKVDRMFPPGAPISGLMVRSGDTPYELKLEIKPPVALGVETMFVVHVSVVGPAAILPLIRTPSAAVIATTGIATGGSAGVGGATVGLKLPAALLYKMTPTAPASCALRDF